MDENNWCSSAPDKGGFRPGDILRMANFASRGGYRLWRVVEVALGGLNQESVYRLQALDKGEYADDHPIYVPCLILETCPGIERL